MSEKCNTNLKQLLDFLDTFFVGQKQDNVIIRFNHCVVMGYDDLLATHYRTYCGTPWQLDFIDSATHYPGTVVIAVRHRLNCLGSTAA